MNNQLNFNIANQLIKARQSNCQWDARNATAPSSVDDAYTIQDIVTKRLGVKVAGWKTSAPDSVSVPIAAPIYSNLLHKSGTRVSASDFTIIGIEGEIAFRIAQDLMLETNPYTREDLIEAVGELVPAIEIVDTRLREGLSENKKLILADNQSNGGLVFGDSISSWSGVDFSKMYASVTVNGVLEYSGVDGNRAGDLFQLMAWAANHCANRGFPFCAGDIITTGTYTGILLVEPGSEVIVDFPEIGLVEVIFSN